MASATNDDGGSVSSSVSINTRLIKIITGSRAILLFPALFLLVGLTVAAMRQPLRADPYQGGEFFSLSWWLHPYERNSNNRLCAIQSNLNAVYALPDASFVWVA